MRLLDSLVQRDDELSDSEDEGEGGRKNHATHRDSDSGISPTGTRRFGLGVGIMGAAPPGVGSAAAAAAGGVPNVAGSGGPSAHHTAPVIDVDAMEIDDDVSGPTRDSAGGRSMGSEVATEPTTGTAIEVAGSNKQLNGTVQPVSGAEGETREPSTIAHPSQ